MASTVIRPDALIGPPLYQPGRPCRWCGRRIRMMYVNARYDILVDDAGATHCTPADRGVESGKPGHCVFGYYADERLMGPAELDAKGRLKGGAFDPLTLSFHDSSCNCSRSLPHTWDLDIAAEPYPWPDLLPWHCGQPMQMRFYAPELAATTGRPGGWHCRAGGTDLVPDRRRPGRHLIVPRGCQTVLDAVDAQTA